MTVLLIVLNLVLHASFIWISYRFLRPAGSGKKPGGTWLIEVSAVAAILLGAAAIATRQRGSPTQDTAALGVAAAALALFAWAVWTARRTPLTRAFAVDRPSFLITSGPFRVNRNPFYTSYLFAHVYALLASGNPWLLGSLAWMATVYAAAALHEERKFLGGPLREKYQQYCRQTGRFLPLPWSIFAARDGARTTAPPVLAGSVRGE
jgi:protein-S-isoprenylcysteine O-methyltransferase Ste14